MARILIKKQQALNLHFSPPVNVGKVTFFSGFIAALRDARQMTGRDILTGVKQQQPQCGHTGNWLGAVGYLALLDQIGTCFKPNNKKAIQKNSISRALEYFTTLPADKVQAIYALRCAFAHDFSLVNVNLQRPGLTHNFQVYKQTGGPLLTLPKKVWNGKLGSRTAKNITMVNLEVLGDTVEDICAKVMQLASAGKLQIMLKGRTSELIGRYSMFTM